MGHRQGDRMAGPQFCAALANLPPGRHCTACLWRTVADRRQEAVPSLRDPFRAPPSKSPLSAVAATGADAVGLCSSKQVCSCQLQRGEHRRRLDKCHRAGGGSSHARGHRLATAAGVGVGHVQVSRTRRAAVELFPQGGTGSPDLLPARRVERSHGGARNHRRRQPPARVATGAVPLRPDLSITQQLTSPL